MFVTAFLTYLCSLLFFGLAAAETAQTEPEMSSIRWIRA